jgi:Xaa-Pro aminopeptidase
MEKYYKRLETLKNFLINEKIDYFLLPNSDEFFLEYLQDSEKRVEYISGFTGSNAFLIIAANQKKSQFFTDGRYILQSKNELNLSDYEVHNTAINNPISWLEMNLKDEDIVAVDSKLISVNFARKLQTIAQNTNSKIIFLDENTVDDIWKDRPNPSKSKAFQHKIKFSGQKSKTKINSILKDTSSDAILFSSPESVCWLLNVRARDTEFTPLLVAYSILFKDGMVDLFADKERFSDAGELKKINFIQQNQLLTRISFLKKKIKTIQIDPSKTNFFIYNFLHKNGFLINEINDPTILLKSCKNKIEIKNAILAHKIDGLALTKFLFWIEENIDKSTLCEITAEKKLLEFRKKNKEFLYPSFNTISAFASNGAVIHYRATEKTNKKIDGNSIYLVDSGGQYFYGTTDVTRTVATSSHISKEMIRDFTLVLKGHIALASVRFKRGTTGDELDILARQFLLLDDKDYDHGTGHGVGSFLSVHEGPCSISKHRSSELLEGMILSNEPGFYKASEYGIRIENLMLVEKYDEDNLQFKTLTLAPIDARLVDFEMLTKLERAWLRDYHEQIFLAHKNKLNKEEKKWLEKIKNAYR